MFTKVLFASDGSPCALKAAGAAAVIAKEFGAPLTLLNVFPPLEESGPVMREPCPQEGDTSW